MAQFSVRIEPLTLRVGERLNLSFEVVNQGEAEINGLSVYTIGPWDKYSIVAVTPNGSFGNVLIGWEFGSPVRIPPGETRLMRIVASPNEPGNHRFTFLLSDGHESHILTTPATLQQQITVTR